jgi:hypothetical protein
MTYPPASGLPAFSPQPSPKRGLSTGVLIGLMAGGLVLMLCLCGGVAGTTVYLASQSAGSDPSSSPQPRRSSTGTGTPHTIVFQASDTAGTIDYVDYYDSDGTQQRDESAPSPWSDTETMDSSEIDYITLSVHGGFADDEQVSCTIAVDGVEVDTGTDTSNAICSANLD